MARPLKFDSVEVMQEAIDAYFDKCDKENIPYTTSGLAMALNVCTETIRNYENKDKFFATVKAAKQRVENHLEKHLYGNNVTGAIFNLKNNYGWKDTQTISPDADKKITFTIEG